MVFAAPLPVGLVTASGPPPRRPPGLAEPTNQMTTLTLRNLGMYCTMSSVFEELGRVGLQPHVDFVHMPLHYDTHLCVGLCYINFTLTEHADTAFSLWQGSQVFAGVRCHGSLNVAWSKQQGFDACVLHDLKHSKHRSDETLKPWVRPDKEAYRRELLQGVAVRSLYKRFRLVAEHVFNASPGLRGEGQNFAM